MKRRMHWPVLLIVLTVVLAACGGGTSTPRAYEISGMIEDDEGRPIENVTLNFSGTTDTATTDRDGKWSRSGLSGTATVTPVHDDYTFDPESVDVSGAASDVNFVGTPLPPTPYTVSGTVKDPDGDPLEHVDMLFSGGFETVTTDADGKWTSPELVREVTVTPDHPDYVFDPEEDTVTIEDAEAPLHFTGTRRTPVSGEVVDDDGDPVGDVTIRLAYGGVEKLVTTDASGEWIYPDSFGDVTVEALDPAYEFADSPRTVSSEAGDVDFSGTMHACNAGDPAEADDPCIVTRIKQVQNIPHQSSGHYKLGADIDASATETWDGGQGFAPIEDFAGVLDGDGNEIVGLHIERPQGLSVGLFARVTPGGTVKDIGVVDVQIQGLSAVAAIAAFNSGTIRNAYTSGQVEGEEGVGGIVAGNNGGVIEGSYNLAVVSGGFDTGGIAAGNFDNGTIKQSYNKGEVHGEEGTGGVTGTNEGTIESSYNTADVTGDIRVGGVVGYTEEGALIEQSYNTGDVTGDTQVGGVVGYNEADTLIDESHNTGAVVALNSDEEEGVGGVAGINMGTVKASYNDGPVEGIGDVGGIVGTNYGLVLGAYNTASVEGVDFVGGVAGYSETTIEQSYNTGSVQGDQNVGGVTGGNGGSIKNSYNGGGVLGVGNVGGVTGYSDVLVEHVYNSGAVTGDDVVGGVVGEDYGDVESSYFDKDVQATDGTPIDDLEDASFGKTTADMHAEATYDDWDFDTIWKVAEGLDYPELRETPRN